MAVLGEDRLVLEPRGKPVPPGSPVAPLSIDLTPVEARSGVVSGRVVSVLIVSSIGALAALSAIWWMAAR